MKRFKHRASNYVEAAKKQKKWKFPRDMSLRKGGKTTNFGGMKEEKANA